MISYLNYFKVRFIVNLQYRAAAIAGFVTQLFFGLVYIFMYLAFYESNPNSVLPMNWPELVTYIWLQQSFFGVLHPYYKDEELLNMITNGNLAYELIRPQSIFIKFYIKTLSTRVVSTLLRSTPLLIVTFMLPENLRLGLPVSFNNFIIFVIAIILACLLVNSFCVIIHILTMFTLDSKGTISIYSVIYDVFSGGIVPLPFFPIWLKKIAGLLPFKLINDFPFRIYSGNLSIAEGMPLLIETTIWIIISIIIGIILSKIALKKAVVQGG